MSSHREPCGCRHFTDRRARELIELCPEHKAEHDARREAARLNRWQPDRGAVTDSIDVAEAP